MTINWKQGLFAAALLLSVSLLFVGCGKKTDKAVADKSTGEIIGEEIDVIEVVPAQTPNAKTNAVKEQKSETPVQQNSEAPAMTPPTTSTPAPNAPTNQAPEPAAAPDASPSSTTSDVTISTSCSETTEIELASDSDFVTESESTCCHTGIVVCSPCSPCTEACQPACQAAPACAPDPVCAPEPTCVPAPACAPVCESLRSPCRYQRIRRDCRPCRTCCRMEFRCQRTCSPCKAACEPACAPACVSACSSANAPSAYNWEQGAPTDSARNSTLPEISHSYNKTTELTDSKSNASVQKAKPSTAIGSDSTSPEAPSIVLPEAK